MGVNDFVVAFDMTTNAPLIRGNSISDTCDYFVSVINSAVKISMKTSAHNGHTVYMTGIKY
jgi:hypothetical protein